MKETNEMAQVKKRPRAPSKGSYWRNWLPWAAAAVVFGATVFLAVNGGASPGSAGKTAGWTGDFSPGPAAPVPAAPQEGPPPTDAPAAAVARTGPLAPDFSIVTTNGKTFRLSEQRGKVVVLNFNATG